MFYSFYLFIYTFQDVQMKINLLNVWKNWCRIFFFF